MGWSFLRTKQDPDTFLKENFREWGDSDLGFTRMLDSAWVGSTFYAAMQTTKPTGERQVWALIVLTERTGEGFGYKDMDETCGPNESRCPARLLSLLTDTSDGYAPAWRQRCRDNLKLSA